MARKEISENTKRRLYAESMGRCMNPECRKELFINNADIIEKAHIAPYCETCDNTFENLIVLCPDCHEIFDKAKGFSVSEVKMWKKIREEEVQKVFCKKYNSFGELEAKVKPLLFRNKAIFENYYLNNSKELWVKFEPEVLVNNRKIKVIIENNLHLIQNYRESDCSNLAEVNKFFLHIDEFEETRLDSEKNRKVLFPEKINSMFGVEPICDHMYQSTEALESLLTVLSLKDKFEKIVIGDDYPYILMKDNGSCVKVFLQDAPRMRQLYFEHNCFRKTHVRLEELNFALRYIKKQELDFEFVTYNNLREIKVKGQLIIFVYEYCLSKAFLMCLSLVEKCVIVNLHGWNGESSISSEAYEFADNLNVKLLRKDELYGFVRELKDRQYDC